MRAAAAFLFHARKSSKCGEGNEELPSRSIPPSPPPNHYTTTQRDGYSLTLHILEFETAIPESELLNGQIKNLDPYSQILSPQP